jgi:hypothetical protein
LGSMVLLVPVVKVLELRLVQLSGLQLVQVMV